MCTFSFFLKFCYISIILMISMCVCIILVFVNKQAFSGWQFPNALIPCSFCDSKINIYIYWLSRLWIYHYVEYVDCNIWFLCLSVLLSPPLQCPYLEIAIPKKLVCWQIREWYTRTCLSLIWYLCSRISKKKENVHIVSCRQMMLRGKS
jgi:hypothetical protein